MSKPRSKTVKAIARALQLMNGGDAQERIEMYQEREIPKPPSGSLDDLMPDDLKAQLKAQLEGPRRVVKPRKKYLNF
jgi:hypothetical protein